MIHRALKLIRTFHRMSLTELASKLDISKSYLSEIESGSKNASLELIGKYSGIFKIPSSSILLFSENLDESGAPKKTVRNIAASKIIKILEWISEDVESNEKKLQH